MHSALFPRGESTFCGRLDVTGVVRRCVAGSSEEALAHHTAAAATAADTETGCPALKASTLLANTVRSASHKEGVPL